MNDDERRPILYGPDDRPITSSYSSNQKVQSSGEIDITHAVYPSAPRQPNSIKETRRSEDNTDQTNGTQDRTKPNLEKRVAIFGALTTACLLIVNIYQMSATQEAANAAREAVRVATDARDDNTISSGDTLIQMKAQSRSIRKSANSAANAAQSIGLLASAANNQAEAMRIANAQTKDALEVSQRAYVFVGKIEWIFRFAEFTDESPPREKPTIIKLPILNSGHLPSDWVRVDAHAVLSYRNPLAVMPKGDHVYSGDHIRIAPGDTSYWTAFTLRSFSVPEIKAINHLDANIGVAGTVKFGNGFGKEEKSDFCFTYFADPKIDWRPCSVGSIESARDMIKESQQPR